MKINILLALLILSLFIGCNDSKLVTPDDNDDEKYHDDFPNAETMLGFIVKDPAIESTQGVISLSSFNTQYNKNSLIDVNASFFSTPGRQEHVSAGEVMVNGQKLTLKEHNYYQDINLPIEFGDTVMVNIQGSEYIDADEFGMYVPKQLNMFNKNSDTIDKSTGYTITWNADPKNEHGIFISLGYFPWKNDHKNLDDLPKEPFYRYLKCDDTGEFTIPPEAFDRVTSGSIIDIELGRCNYIIAGKTMKYLLNATAVCSRIFEVK